MTDCQDEIKMLDKEEKLIKHPNFLNASKLPSTSEVLLSQL
jgi:hypothetical protein